MLSQCGLVGFVPTKDTAQARSFFVETLGLELVSEDSFALVVRAHGNPIRVVSVGEFTPAPYTILGWEVPDIAQATQDLAARGVVFERYAYFEQDAAGIWTAPDGSRIAWFHDPDGNTLSLAQH